MHSFWRMTAPFVLVILLAIGEFLWINASTTSSNIWITRQNSSTTGSSVIWQGPATTPWPALGARKPYSPTNVNTQTNGNSAVQNQNRNVQNKNLKNNLNEAVSLSYGPASGSNVGQNRDNVNRGVSSGNIGIDLSYGLNLNQNRHAVTSSQSASSPKTSPTYSMAAQTQNTNNQNNPKTSQISRIPTLKPGSQGSTINTHNIQSRTKSNQNSQIPTAKPSLQRANSQTGTSNVNNIQQPSTMTGSTLQSGNNTAPVTDEDEELRQFSETLLRKDVNNAGKYVTINYQGKTTSRSVNDEAPLPLLMIQREAYEIPTIQNLLALHNNYILETNINEHVSAQEKMEENTLLDTLLSTAVMQHTRNFLIQKGVIAKDPKLFKDKLKEIWFNMYSRGQGKIGSSGFEHVFLAEIKGRDISGLHNWIYFHDAEAKRSANYLGYMKKIELNNNKGAILKYHFNLNGIDKPVGSMFIGTSPELEIALYTTCFLLKPDQVCPLRLDGNKFIIRTYTFRYRGKNMIGSAFPEI